MKDVRAYSLHTEYGVLLQNCLQLLCTIDGLYLHISHHGFLNIIATV